MEPYSIVEYPRVDEDGYFDELVSCQVDEKGAVIFGLNCHAISPPESDEEHFYRLSYDATKWEAEKIPTTAAECVGITVKHSSQTARSRRLRQVFADLTADSTTHRLVQDADTLALSVEEIPEKTAEEVRTEKAAELKAAYEDWMNEGATLISSLGFEIDADAAAVEAVASLVNQTAEGEITEFRDAENVMHTGIEVADLAVMKGEIERARLAARQEKWDIGAAIDAAATVTALNAIEIAFTRQDYSTEEGAA